MSSSKIAMPPAAECVCLELEEPALDSTSLAGMWEADVRIRNRLRIGDGKLMRWPKNKEGKEVVGKCSMISIGMNARPLTLLARYWCPKTKKAVESPGIDMVRKEAR